jgi:hypothetical protein
MIEETHTMVAARHAHADIPITCLFSQIRYYYARQPLFAAAAITPRHVLEDADAQRQRQHEEARSRERH